MASKIPVVTEVVEVKVNIETQQLLNLLQQMANKLYEIEQKVEELEEKVNGN